MVEAEKQVHRAREAERLRFLSLGDRLTQSSGPDERQHIKEELARMTFGDCCSGQAAKGEKL